MHDNVFIIEVRTCTENNSAECEIICHKGSKIYTKCHKKFHFKFPYEILKHDYKYKSPKR
jgi:hypothetical protein